MADDSVYQKLVALRSDAWSKVVKTAEYQEYAALKVAAESLERLDPGRRAAPVRRLRTLGGGIISGNRRVSQAEAAEAAIRKANRPMTIAELIEAVPAEGGVVGGDNPEINLSSSLSRAENLQSVRVQGIAKWWLTDRINELQSRTAGDQ